MFTKIHNLVMAVKNAEEAAKLYTDNFGLQVSRTGTLPEQGLKVVFLPIGDATVEFIEPLNPQEGPVAKFLQSRGEGLYMVELEVASVDQTVQSLKEKGVRLLGADPESRAKGGLVFIHPQSAKGLLIALIPKQ